MLKTAISGNIVRNSHSHVVNELGKAIVGGHYPSGSLMPGDAELADRFAVSRTVLREAMKTLTAKGLVVPRARVGTRVTERTRWNLFDADVLTWHLESGIDGQFITHLSEIRLAFEPYAARLAARHATGNDVAAMVEATEKMRTATSMESFALADLEFHLAMLAAAKNPFLYSLGNLIEAALVTSFKLSSPFGEPERHLRTAMRHRHIADAIAQGEPDAAASAVSTVIIDGKDRVADRVVNTPLERPG
jgi:DNA-binding FadR family transcriptional regulator